MFYICANHLGNPLDMPERVKKMFSLVDFAIVESEKAFLKDVKFAKLNFSAQILFYEHDKKFFNKIINLLKENKKIMFIPEMGYPGIADPGPALITEIIKNNLPISIIPGPSIGPTAVSFSGFSGKGYILLELFNNSIEQSDNILESVKEVNLPIVILDYPTNTEKILKQSLQIFKNRDVQVFINLGIFHREKIFRGNHKEIISYFNDMKNKKIFIDDGTPNMTTIVFSAKI